MTLTTNLSCGMNGGCFVMKTLVGTEQLREILCQPEKLGFLNGLNTLSID